MKLETAWLGLTVLSELGHLYLVFFFLYSPRSCKSEANHEHHKVEQISRSAFENWFVWTEMHESEWEFGKIRAILTWSADNAEPNGCKKPQSFQAPWKSEWFLQAVLLEFSGDQSEHAGTGSLQSTCSGMIWLLHVRIIHGWELPKAFAHMRDIVWSFYNERSICKALWLSSYRYCHCILSLLDFAPACRKCIFCDSDYVKKVPYNLGWPVRPVSGCTSGLSRI